MDPKLSFCFLIFSRLPCLLFSSREAVPTFNIMHDTQAEETVGFPLFFLSCFPPRCFFLSLGSPTDSLANASPVVGNLPCPNTHPEIRKSWENPSVSTGMWEGRGKKGSPGKEKDARQAGFSSLVFQQLPELKNTPLKAERSVCILFRLELERPSERPRLEGWARWCLAVNPIG